MKTSPTDPCLMQRRQMVASQIRARGVLDERVCDAMECVPREKFVPAEDAASAFADRALPIAMEQTISQPYMVAAMTEALCLQPGHRVLEVGTGSGYQAAILARLAGQVYTIERLETLQRKARDLLESLGIFNIRYLVGDGSLGWPEEAPFDRILVTAGAPHIPSALIEQLTDNGRLVIPVGHKTEQTLTIVERDRGRMREYPRFPCRFVRLVGKQAWPDHDC